MALTIITQADTYDLTTLARLKLELGITDASQDQLLTAWIHEESEDLAGLCKRVFSEETVSETFGLVEASRSKLILSRYPVTDITSVSVDGSALVTTDYSLNGKTGILLRVSSNSPIQWTGTEATVVYTGGYELLTTLPRDLERAALTQIRARKYASTRDPSIRSENVVGVLSMSYGSMSGSGQSGTESLPSDVAAVVSRYKDLRASVA